MTFKSYLAITLTFLGLSIGASSAISKSPIIKEAVEAKASPKELFKKQESKESVLVLKGATPLEKKAMEMFQDRGITSKNALATILGNIKQESRFHANICEGGARIGYNSCRRGGYGLIQWTTPSRFYGLGRHAKRLNLNPSSAEAQLSYIFHEPQWKKIEPAMKTPGKSIEQYMRWAYSWLGWGIAGHRTRYAYEYANRMYAVEVH